MSIVHRIVWGAWFLFGAYIIHESLQMSYTGDFGPGSGFFPFWLGILVIALSAAEVTKTFRQRSEPLPIGFFPDGSGFLRMVSILGSLIVTLLLLERIGFSLTMLLVSIFLLRVLGGRQPWWLTAALALAGSFGTALLFRQLQVMLPGGIVGI